MQKIKKNIQNIKQKQKKKQKKQIKKKKIFQNLVLYFKLNKQVSY